MNPETTAPAVDGSDEISTLIETLLATEQRLEVLTAGEVDTVAGRDGRAFLLRRAQEELRYSEAAKQAVALNELRGLFDLIPAMVWFKDTGNKIVRINQRAADDIGKPVAELEGKSMDEIYPQDAAKYYADDLEVIRSEEPKLNIVETIRNRAGEKIWVQTDKVPVCDKDGKVVGIVVVAQDVTERKRAEETLRISEERLRAALSASGTGTYRWDIRTNELDWDDSLDALFGLPQGQTVRSLETFIGTVHPDDRPGLMERCERCAQEGADFSMELRVPWPDGSLHWLADRGKTFLDSEGRPLYMTGACVDITERKRAAALLAESGERLALAKQSAQIGIWEWDIGTNKLVWDAEMYRLYGIRPEDFSGAYDAWQQGVHPEDRKRSEAEIFAAVDGVNGFHAEFRVVWPGGEVRHIEAHAAVYHAAGGGSKRMIGVNWDITERHRAQENFHRLAAIVESSADAIISKTLQGVITSWNPAAEKMFGYAAAEILGQPLLMLLPPERANEEVEILAGFAKGELVRHFETVRLRKGGQRFDVAVTISPIKDAEGKIIGASKIVRDITELKNLEEQYRQAQKMESFGQLAGGVAHDFNNILAVVQMQVGLFKDDSRLSPEQVDCISEIGVSADRAAALTRQLLVFSRKEILQLRDLDLNQSINGMTNMLRRILGEHIEVQFRFSLQPLGIHADAGMMDQVLMNLAVNSRDAMPKGGQLIIETSAVNFGGTGRVPPAQGRAGAFVCLSVSDNGCGIPAANLTRIFEPFFTTKPVGKGTGLGLATLFGIVQQHKGWVNVESEVGRGTTFRIYLPRLDKILPALPKVEHPKLSTLPGGNETILLVEDDDFLRPSVCNTLSRLGYHVIPVSNGIKALEIWQGRSDEIEMLITDLVMPGGMTGKHLGELFLKQKPKLQVIYASGYSAEIAGTDFPLKEGVNFLTKPFQTEKLARTIRDRFDNKAGL